MDIHDYVHELRTLKNVQIARLMIEKYNLPITEHYASQLVARIKNGEKLEYENFGKVAKTITAAIGNKYIIISDVHGWLYDEAAFLAFLKVLEREEFSHLIINGDIADFPFLSRHDKHLINKNHPIFDSYTESAEIEFVKRNIFKPIKELFKGNVILKTGNHDERVTSPKSLSKDQLEKLLELQYKYHTVNYWEMLQIKDFGFAADEKPYTTLNGDFAITHGLSVAKNASEKNIYEYFGSGATGHTHRLNTRYVTSKKGTFKWFETGCLCRKDNVGYLPTGKQADWQHGFVTVDIVQHEYGFDVFGRSHEIINGRTVFNGVMI